MQPSYTHAHPYQDDTNQLTLNKVYGRTVSSTLTKEEFWLTKIRIDEYSSTNDVKNFPIYIHLNEISHGDKILKFSAGLSLELEITYEQNLYVTYNETFGIYGSGKTRDEAVRDFNSSFIEFYTDIVNTPDVELAESSIRFKERLQSFATLINSD